MRLIVRPASAVRYVKAILLGLPSRLNLIENRTPSDSTKFQSPMTFLIDWAKTSRRNRVTSLGAALVANSLCREMEEHRIREP